jgi:hypothetical protein
LQGGEHFVKAVAMLWHDLIGASRRLSAGAGYPGNRGSESRVGIELLRAGFAADVTAAVAAVHHLISFFRDLASLKQNRDLLDNGLRVFAGEAGQRIDGTDFQAGTAVGASLREPSPSVLEVVSQVPVLLHFQNKRRPSSPVFSGNREGIYASARFFRF